MPEHQPPQPDPSRLTPFAGSAVVVAITPHQPPLVLLTAASLAEAMGGRLYCAYVDTARYTDEEYPDGKVRHLPLNPDSADDSWSLLQEELKATIAETLAGRDLEWHFRFLAGRVDRALTHLARAVDAATFVVGTHTGRAHRVADFCAGRWTCSYLIASIGPSWWCRWPWSTGADRRRGNERTGVGASAVACPRPHRPDRHWRRGRHGNPHPGSPFGSLPA